MRDIFDADKRATDPEVAEEATSTLIFWDDEEAERGRTGPNLTLLLVCAVVLGLGVLAGVVLIQALMNLVAWEPMLAERCGP